MNKRQETFFCLADFFKKQMKFLEKSIIVDIKYSMDNLNKHNKNNWKENWDNETQGTKEMEEIKEMFKKPVQYNK